MPLEILTVHDAGPDGDTTYQLTIGRDISPQDAQELVARSGGYEVYATHHYESGRRVEQFVSKAYYLRLKGMMVSVPAPHSLAEVEADIELRQSSSRRGRNPEASASKRWWQFWR